MNFPTWSDLNDESIVPPLGARKAPDLGPVAVMAACQPDIPILVSSMDQPRSHPFFNDRLMTDDQISLAGPSMGSPYAAMMLESLVIRGVETIAVLGWCGAVNSTLKAGDIILADPAIIDEGTSRNYARLVQDPAMASPDAGLTEHLLQFSQARMPDRTISRQTVWTTDAIYRETPKKVAFFRELGADAVEMECSALFSVAEYRKVKIAALLVVSDSLGDKKWQPGFKKEAFKAARKAACRTIIEFAKQLASGC